MDQQDVYSIVQVTTTVPSQQVARQLATRLLEESLVACVQIDAGVESHYRWEGKMEVAEEYRLTAKTTAILGERVIERLGELHPYDTPEIILVAVDSVAQRYAQWVASEVKSSP